MRSEASGSEPPESGERVERRTAELGTKPCFSGGTGGGCEHRATSPALEKTLTSHAVVPEFLPVRVFRLHPNMGKGVTREKAFVRGNRSKRTSMSEKILY